MPPSGSTLAAIEQVRRITFVLFDGVEELDVVGPLEVLGAWSRLFPSRGWYTRAESLAGRSVLGAAGLGLVSDGPLEGHHDLLVVPGGPGTRPLLGDRTIREQLAHAAHEATYVVGVCTGALLLADAGLLGGCRAVTHWNSLELLASLDPTIEVCAGARWVDEGTVLTSAGISAGIDVALHLVERLGGLRERQAVAHFLEYESFPEAADDRPWDSGEG
jgi:transcriptional regulator GlxA family with amidase domain